MSEHGTIADLMDDETLKNVTIGVRVPFAFSNTQLFIMAQLAEALDLINTQEAISHGDLSPSNVLLLRDPSVYTLDHLIKEDSVMINLIDFGGAGYLGDKVIMTTPEFSAPEAKDEGANLSTEKEIYSFSMTALVLLLGRGFSEGEIEAGIENVEYPMRKLSEFLLRGIATAPGDRPSWSEIKWVVGVAVDTYALADRGLGLF
jgi:serine/threonine protein kinase